MGTTSAGTSTSTTADTTDNTTDPTGTDATTAVDTDPKPDCEDDSECPGDLICFAGSCEPPPPECFEESDCPEGQYCAAGKCVDKCKPGGEEEMGMVEASYIWIPSQNDGTVSKVDTLTLQEIARYRTGPNGNGESGSRTAVSADGRFVIVNGRSSGRTTMIAADPNACKGPNTSQNANDILPWNEDDCVIWSYVHPEGAGNWTRGPRGVTWTLGTWNDDPNVCAYEDPKVWLGYRATAPGVAHLVRMDGQTGAVEEIIEVPNWVGQSQFAPYGGALDPQQRPWFAGLRGEVVRVNTDQDPITVSRWTPPSYVQSYGFTVGPDGNPWHAGCSGPVTMFDVANEEWIAIPGTSACHRGIAVSKENRVWVASNGPCALVEIDGDSKTLINYHTLPQCNTAIGPSIDIEQHLWLVDQSGYAWKFLNGNVADATQVIVPGSHYVYSDMTGGQARFAIPQ